jgi:hypothetical protein
LEIHLSTDPIKLSTDPIKHVHLMSGLDPDHKVADFVFAEMVFRQRVRQVTGTEDWIVDVDPTSRRRGSGI